MEKKIKVTTTPSIAFDSVLLRDEIAREIHLKENTTFHYRILRRSIDARSKNIKVNLELEISDSAFQSQKLFYHYKEANHQNVIHIIGAGPAGLFAALRLLESGIKPVIIERGKDVRSRRRDLAAINKLHIVNEDSNYCFGEGGAGTYSDGKLYTRSGKRGSIEKILKVFVQHGAGEEILYEAHPHIGTNKLPGIIEAMRKTIIDNGGEIYFQTRLTDIILEANSVKAIRIVNTNTHKTEELSCRQLILATGHSARDIYELLNSKKIEIEAKPFALGVRIEHPQELIDKMQYHCQTKKDIENIRQYLPAASYAWVEQTENGGVYSFCMCPGGIIAPCATSQEEIVTNGWSPSKRNNPFANSGIVVEINDKIWKHHHSKGALAGLYFQKQMEHNSWISGGKTQTAPAQRLNDFLNKKHSNSLPSCSYLPGIKSVALDDVLHTAVVNSLRQGFKQVGKKMKAYLSNESVIVAVESRTSTPVRIPRDKDSFRHIRIKNLFPCGEGAGYAGGIVSAAMDGDKIANYICESLV
jgi:hypothetical protein